MTGARFAAVVFNPAKADERALRRAVAEAAKAAGWGQSRWYPTTVDDGGCRQTQTALEEGAAMVVAVGGDGTMREVAEALRGTGIPIGMVPAGTGNLLARNLGMTLGDMKHSLRTAFADDVRAVDVGVVDIEHPDLSRTRHAYLVMAGLGMDAKMAAHTNERLKRRVGWLAYINPIARSVRDKNRIRIRYRLDEQSEKSIRAHTILIGNCGTLPANILLLPDAAVDDGELDIVILRPDGFLGWLQISIKIFWENGVMRRTRVGRRLIHLAPEVRALNYLRGRELVLRLSMPEDIELDGDPFGTAIAARTWVEPGALLVKVPGGG